MLVKELMELLSKLDGECQITHRDGKPIEKIKETVTTVTEKEITLC